jgi:glutamate dehydrogenase (NAD(P)+)
MNEAPRKIIIEDEESGAPLGFLAIDSTIAGRAQGGLRMAPDVSLDELGMLARAMTLKYGFLGLPQGGAKAGVVGDPESEVDSRRAALHKFAKRIEPLLNRREYVPYSDLGTSNAEIRWMLESVGLPVLPRQYRGHPSGDYTAGTVFESARAAAAVKRLNLASCRVAIEGFGEVGSPLAGMFVRAGARVVAISTSFGGLYDPAGLDIARLRSMADQMGGSVVTKYGAGERIEKSHLKGLSVDIFCPCARNDSVHASDVAQMHATILSCGANCPITREAESLLWRSGVLCVPDFVANCGGVLGGTMDFCGWRPGEVFAWLEHRFRGAVERLIRDALEAGKPLREKAEDVAFRRFREVKLRAEHPSVLGRAFGAAIAIYRAGWAPAWLVARLSKGYFNQRIPNSRNHDL